MSFEVAFISLFVLATLVALVARWLRIPYTVALVGAGLVLGSLHTLDPPHLTKELLYSLVLPGLLFEAAFHLEFARFLQNARAIAALAVPGVVAGIALTAALVAPLAGALGFAGGFNFSHGLVFGALIAATDPIAVVALFRTLGVPRRLAVLIEGESLLNDGAAVVLFGIVLGFAQGAPTSVTEATIGFVRIVGMGALIGIALGYGISRVIQRVDDPMIEITLTTLAAYGSFVLAEHLHNSGVIATVCAGMLCGNYGARTGMSPTTRVAVASFWEYLAFALNSVVFLLIGFEVHISELLSSWLPIGVAYLAMTAGRATVVAAVTFLLRRSRERIPWRWSMALTWGGLRGGLSMVLVLGLPEQLPHRQLLITMTFGVVLLSILIQGLTMGPLLRWLGIAGTRRERERFEAARAMSLAAGAALAELDVMDRDRTLAGSALATLRDEYGQRQQAAEERRDRLALELSDLQEEELRSARRHLLAVERHAVDQAFRRGQLGPEAFERALARIDARRLELDENIPADTSQPTAHS